MPDLQNSIEIVKIGAGRRGYRTYPGTGGIWCGDNAADGFSDGEFNDWGLAVAVAQILNAIIDGRLVLKTAESQS